MRREHTCLRLLEMQLQVSRQQEESLVSKMAEQEMMFKMQLEDLKRSVANTDSLAPDAGSYVTVEHRKVGISSIAKLDRSTLDKTKNSHSLFKRLLSLSDTS